MPRTQPRSTTPRLTARRPTPTRRPPLPRRRKQPQPTGLAGIAQQVMSAVGNSGAKQKAGGLGKGKLGLLAGLGAGGLAFAKRKGLFGGSKEQSDPLAHFPQQTPADESLRRDPTTV